ncbi:MAG: hypothetical protein ACTSVY_05105, partial [Candidatus Helarchaeota archaeon]
MTLEEKYIEFLDVLNKLEEISCNFRDPKYLFERDLLVAKELAKIKEEEISKIRLDNFKLDESLRNDFLNFKIEKKGFRKRSEIPPEELEFFDKIANKLNQSVINSLQKSGYPCPDIGIKNNWIYVNCLDTSFQITNTVKLYDFDTCERVFYEIIRILIPELKRLKTLEFLEEIIIRMTDFFKKKIFEEEKKQVILQIKLEYDEIIKEKEREKREIIEDYEKKYQLLLEENEALRKEREKEVKKEIEETPLKEIVVTKPKKTKKKKVKKSKKGRVRKPKKPKKKTESKEKVEEAKLEEEPKEVLKKEEVEPIEPKVKKTKPKKIKKVKKVKKSKKTKKKVKLEEKVEEAKLEEEPKEVLKKEEVEPIEPKVKK